MGIVAKPDWKEKLVFWPLDQDRAVGARGWPIDSPVGSLKEFWKVQFP
jgi:hypothetical protein